MDIQCRVTNHHYRSLLSQEPAQNVAVKKIFGIQNLRSMDAGNQQELAENVFLGQII